MKKIVTGFVTNVATVAPTLLVFVMIASGMDTTSWKPNGIEQPANIPIAHPAAMRFGGISSRTILERRSRKNAFVFLHQPLRPDFMRLDG